MKALCILNDAPYGNERTYNDLRLAGAIAQQEGNEKLLARHPNEVHLFMIGDAVSSAHHNQKVPPGFYSIEVMLGNVIWHVAKILYEKYWLYRHF